MLARAEEIAGELARRRTVRQFSERPVPQALIAACLRAACTAPSGANLQPWHFVAVGDAALKRRLRAAAEAEERELYAHRAPPEWLAALTHTPSPMGFLNEILERRSSPTSAASRSPR